MPTLAVPLVKSKSLTDAIPVVPTTVKTTYGEASFTTTLLIPNSLSRVDGKSPFEPGASGVMVLLVYVPLNRFPVPSSMIVAIPL